MQNRPAIIETKGLALGYKKAKTIQWVAEGISFSLGSGELTCVLGPNGVGKSSLIRAILGQGVHTRGGIYFQGKPIRSFSPQSLARSISVVLTDRFSAGNLAVKQLVALGRIPFTNWLGSLAPEDEAAVEAAITATKTTYLKDRKISEISDGQLQKVMIARALAQDGELMILDEPTAHLDLVNRFEIMHLLRAIARDQNKAVLVITHDLEIAVETADEFLLMPFEGPLIAGKPEDLILTGAINRLLPSGQMRFSPVTGKIQLSSPPSYEQVKGPEEVAQWLKLALAKNKISLDSRISITASREPLGFLIEKGGSSLEVNSIEEVLRELYEV